MSDGTKGSWWVAGGVGLGLGGLGGCFDAGLAIFDGISTWLGYRAKKNGMRRRYIRNLSPAEYREFRREERRDGIYHNPSHQLTSWYVWNWRSYESERWQYAEGRMAVEGRYALPWAGAEWQAEIIKMRKEGERRARIRKPLNECDWLEKLERQQQYDRGLRAARAGIPQEIWRGNWRDPDYDYRDESKFLAYCRAHSPFYWTIWLGKPLPCTEEEKREMEECLDLDRRCCESVAQSEIDRAAREAWEKSHPTHMRTMRFIEEFRERVVPKVTCVVSVLFEWGKAFVLFCALLTVVPIVINLLFGFKWDHELRNGLNHTWQTITCQSVQAPPKAPLSQREEYEQKMRVIEARLRGE